MREGKKFKKLLIGVAAAAMTMLCTLPVSAATKSFKPITVKAGRCIHLLNTNIQSNAITNYSYRIQPQSSGTRYDIVYAYGGEAEALKGARTDSGQIINNTYIKSSTSSNQGMIACLKVTSGSVKLSVKTYLTECQEQDYSSIPEFQSQSIEEHKDHQERSVDQDDKNRKQSFYFTIELLQLRRALTLIAD